MLNIQDILQDCPKCTDGMETVGQGPDGLDLAPITCRTCGGELFVSHTSLHPDLVSLIQSIKDKVDNIDDKVSDIKEVVDEIKAAV